MRILKQLVIFVMMYLFISISLVSSKIGRLIQSPCISLIDIKIQINEKIILQNSIDAALSRVLTPLRRLKTQAIRGLERQFDC